MVLLVTVALIIIIFSFLIHYYQHFRFEIQKCYENKNPSNTPSNTPDSDISIIDAQINSLRTRNRFRCCCIFVSNGGEEFDFVPISFLFYLLFMISLCILTICLEIANYSYYKNNETMVDLLLGYSIESYHNNSLFQVHRINSRIKAKELSVIYILDYVLIYGIMILSVWESLFSFCRYYNTFIAITKFQCATTKQILKRYPIYGIIFCIMFLIQIHLYYWTFPIIIGFFCVFNCYCTCKFAAMLTEKYKLFIEMEDGGVITRENQNILSSVIWMKNTSLICGILQTMYLSALIITYNVNIVFYLPILWGIAGFLMTLNFVRNRRFIQRKLFKYQQVCKYCCYHKIKTNVVARNKRLNNPSNPANGTREIIQFQGTEIVLSKSDSNHNNKKQIETKNNDKYHQFNDPKHCKKPNLHQQTQSVNIYELRRANFKKKANQKHSSSVCDIFDIKEEDETAFSKKPTLRNVQSDPVMSEQKIQQKTNLYKEMNKDNASKKNNVSLNDNTLLRSTSLNHDTSSRHVDFQLSEIKTEEVDPMHFDEDNDYSSMKRTSSMRKNKALEVLGIESPAPNTPNLQSHQNASGSSKKAIRSRSHSKLPAFFNNISKSGSHKLYQPANDELYDNPAPPTESPLELPILSPLDQIPTMSLHESLKKNDSDLPKQFNIDISDNDIKSAMPSKPILKHAKSNSVPVVMDDLLIALNVWAKSGFCSRKSINSVKQLNEYQKQFK